MNPLFIRLSAVKALVYYRRNMTFAVLDIYNSNIGTITMLKLETTV